MGCCGGQRRAERAARRLSDLLKSISVLERHRHGSRYTQCCCFVVLLRLLQQLWHCVFSVSPPHFCWNALTNTGVSPHPLTRRLLYVDTVFLPKHFPFSTWDACVCMWDRGRGLKRKWDLGWGDGVPCIFCSCSKLRPAASLATSTPPVTVAIDCLL